MAGIVSLQRVRDRALPTEQYFKATSLGLMVVSKYDAGFGTVSPDGRWMAFVSDESGNSEVYVTTFPEPARRWQVSTDGGTFPRWSRDGSELFFASAAGDLFVAEVAGSGETFTVGRVRGLHSWHLATTFRH